jgi:hypothetical protein
MGYRLRVLGFWFWVIGYGSRFKGLGFRAQGLGIYLRGMRRVWRTRLRAGSATGGTGSWCKSQGIRFRVKG